ncbi:MAG TPA: hypothetical protein VE665_01885 [Hyphomicrobiaceae bacterium]|nr:hypothetical protein [Hyphomicrobiaceae bacterium]
MATYTRSNDAIASGLRWDCVMQLSVSKTVLPSLLSRRARQ